MNRTNATRSGALQLASGATERPPVCLSALRALIGGNEVAARSILRNFSTHSADDANQLRVACLAGDPQAAADAAHKLKSAACAIGAFALAGLCADIERAGAQGDTAGFADLLTRFSLEEASVAAFLELCEREDRLIF